MHIKIQHDVIDSPVSAACFAKTKYLQKCPVWSPHRARFAGAGLFDSVPSAPAVEQAVDYSTEPLLCDLQRATLGRIAAAAVAVEAALGAPQDVEGVVDEGGDVFVVQARPQVGLI